MQKDSLNVSTSGPVTLNQVNNQESPIKSLQCSQCTIHFKSKVYLFEHLNKVHGMDVDAALRDAGLKSSGTDKVNADNDSKSSGDDLKCQRCDFSSSSLDVFNEHEKQCHQKSEDQNMIGDLNVSENPETNTTVISTNQHSEASGAKENSSVYSVVSITNSNSKSVLNSSKDLKTYKRPLQTIIKYFAASSESNGKPPVKLADSSKLIDSTKGTIILQESPSSSSPNSSGVFKVTAMHSVIDNTDVSNHYLRSDHFKNTDLRPPKPKEQSSEKVPEHVSKRTNNESSICPPAKKAKIDKDKTRQPQEANASQQQPSSNTDFSFEVSEDEGEKKRVLVNGVTDISKVYFCKHCDFSDMGMTAVSTHYQSTHPYVRYTAAYIQDPSNGSATYRCLHCPVEFGSVVDLERHYTENHPEAPNIFTMQSCDLSLVHRCFVCPFTTNVLRTIKTHYKENHPTLKVDNSLMYYRYVATSCQEGSPQLNTCEKTPGSERPGVISPESACTPRKEIKNAPSPQHPTSTGTDMVLYNCHNCNFSHKSVIVMHVHYQKCHPGEEITIEKIKLLARVTPSSQTTADICPNAVKIPEKSTSQTNISDFFKKTNNKAELSPREPTPEACKTPKTKEEPTEDKSKGKKSPTTHDREMSTKMDSLSSSSPDKFFYCQLCSYSSTKIKSVVGHHNAKHAMHSITCIEEVLLHSAKVQKKLKSEAEASASSTSADSKTSKPVEVCSKKEQQQEGEAADSSVMECHPYAFAENLFYCQECNYGNPAVKGVANHQNQVHRNLRYSRESIIEHTALIRDEIEKSKSQATELSFSTRLPLPIINEGDEDMFFCHFCNYRQNSVDYVLKHYLKKHRGFTVKGEQVRLYTSMVREKSQKLHKKTSANQEVNHASLGGKGNEKEKTKKHGKSVSDSAPLSMTASQTQRNLQCYRCSYSTQYVYVLKRHIWKIHRANRSVTEVLRLCFRQGNLQAGYHCDVCVFSHEKAAVVYKHYQEQHPARGLSLKHVTTRLFIGPETRSPKRKKPQRKYTDGLSDSDGTDGSLSSQRSGQNETKTYSCKACPFKGSSVSVITRHYRAVHPWSVKEDGSVLDVVNSKKSSANRQDNDDMPGSFESYQEPLEFDNSPGSPHEATASSKSPTKLCCPYCPARFDTQHGLSVHCGMKHQQAVNSDEPQEQVQTRMHVFKCPHCSYLNTSYQGVLTHCQMKHPALESRVDSLHVDEAQLDNWGDSFRVKEPGGKLRLKGYMCETCLQIFSTLERLNKHSEKAHTKTVANTAQNALKQPLKPSAVSKIKQFKTLTNRGSVSQSSFLSKKMYAVVRCQYCPYSCSTKIALGRHLRVHHKNVSISKLQDCVLKCSLCTNTYFKKKRLGSHYIKKHGRDSFLKYFVPVYKQAQEKPAPTSQDRPLTPQPESMPEECKASMTMEEKKQSLFYRCPSCSYVNASYHGTLTHCQMQHPDIVARADELQTVEILETNMVNCTIGKGSNARGFMCKICPLIYASLKNLKIHCERDHDQATPTPAEHSADIETEKQPVRGPRNSALRALRNQTSAMGPTEIGFSHQFGTPETCHSNTVSVQKTQQLYKCHICSYKGIFRRYLQVHYKNTHKLDPLTTHKLLEKYNKCKRKKASKLPEAEAEAEAESEESAPNKCKKCPELMFDSSQMLVAHYSTFHSSDGIVDFTVLSQGTKKGSTGLYRCVHCNKQMNGIRKLWYHLDCHRETAKKRAVAEKTMAQPGISTTPETKSFKLCRQEEVIRLETVEELTSQWNVTKVQTFAWPLSPLSSPLKPTGLEQQELESEEVKHTCKHCRRSFMSLKGLRAHERSHAAIKKLNNLSTSVLKHNIDKYVLFKSGTIKPFLCSFCSYRTTLMGLWRSHFMRTHHDVIADLAETENHDEEPNNWPESDEEPENTETSLYLEPPDVQRQLNHYSLMAQADAPSKTIVQETRLPDSLHHCEFCNFSSEHLSSVRRHYLNRHGKKVLRCKDCNFFTGLRKTLEVHMETGHSTFQSEPTHNKDLRCPFCLYQTKNKNNMIDHIVLHREERVVPIEVRRSKLSRYLQGIIFRCHKCTFTSGSADSLRSHMTKHDDIKPYKCRLCYFDCTRLNDLEAHLSDKHQVVRNHELVGQVSLDQLQAGVGRTPEEEEGCSSNLEDNNDSEDVETEEFVTDCDEEIQTKKANQKQEQDSKNKESPAESSVLDLQYKNAKPNKPKGEQDPQQQRAVILPDQPKCRDSEDRSLMFTQQEGEAVEGSSIAKKAQAKLHNKAIQDRALDIEARADDDILRNILLLDEDGSRTHKKNNWNTTFRTDNVQNVTIIVDEMCSIPLPRNRKISKNPISAPANEDQMQINNSRAQESLTADRQLPTVPPKCPQLKISHTESLAVSFTNCKKEQEHNEKNSEEVRENYGEMPVLENEYFKEEMHPLDCCKDEDQSGHSEQMQDKEDEMITEDDGNQCMNQKYEETNNPHVPKGALTVTEAAAEDPATTEDKPFTCELCGRNLLNSSELKRHIMRHGL